MAVTKRTRYEVLRRDNHTCRYCGTAAPDATLTVDHVTPKALGGSDGPENLVAACRDCNAGKSSTSPDAVLVADVQQDAVRWAFAIKQAAAIETARVERLEQMYDWFESVWDGLMPTWAELPDDTEWRATVARFIGMGLAPRLIEEAVELATERIVIAQRLRWRYFCGICWEKVGDLQQTAHQILAAEED